MGEGNVVDAAKGFFEGVQRTGADVAENNADRAYGKTQHSLARTLSGVIVVAEVGSGGCRRRRLSGVH